MVHVEHRVAHLEGRVEGHGQMLIDVVGAVRHLEARMEQRFTGIDLRFTGVESRLTTIEGRITTLGLKLDQRVGAVEQKVDQRVGALEQKQDSHFRWLVGIQFAVLIALLASFVAG